MLGMWRHGRHGEERCTCLNMITDAKSAAKSRLSKGHSLMSSIEHLTVMVAQSRWRGSTLPIRCILRVEAGDINEDSTDLLSLCNALQHIWHSDDHFEDKEARLKPVDNLWTTHPKRAQLIHILATYLTRLLPSSSASERLKPCGSLRRLAVRGAFCLFVGSIVLQMQPVQAATQADQFRLYAHSRIIDWKQFNCFAKIIHKESRWNPQARNGSHFGLGQMR